MKRRFPKYKTGEAPAVLMPEEMHDTMRGVYNRWRAAMTEKMGGSFDWGRVSEAEMRDLSEEMFDKAKIPQNVRQQFWEQFNEYRATLSN